MNLSVVQRLTEIEKRLALIEQTLAAPAADANMRERLLKLEMQYRALNARTSKRFSTEDTV